VIEAAMIAEVTIRIALLFVRAHSMRRNAAAFVQRLRNSDLKDHNVVTEHLLHNSTAVGIVSGVNLASDNSFVLFEMHRVFHFAIFLAVVTVMHGNDINILLVLLTNNAHGATKKRARVAAGETGALLLERNSNRRHRNIVSTRPHKAELVQAVDAFVNVTDRRNLEFVHVAHFVSPCCVV